MSRGKKYKEIVKEVDKTKKYPLEEAINLVKKIKYVKFEQTIEVSLNLNLKRGNSLRDTVILPNQFQNEKKILVFAKNEKADEAKQAGAAFVGDEDLIQKIKDGWLDFDVVIATPDMMKEIGKIGMILGRKGLMPNPKTQTVTNNIKDTVIEFRKGKTEIRTDKTGVLHLAVAKESMETSKIEENIKLVLSEVARKKPADSKGIFVKQVYISSTMSPGLKIAI